MGASARGGISETGSDIIPNLDKKRNRGAIVNKLAVHCRQGEKIKFSKIEPPHLYTIQFCIFKSRGQKLKREGKNK